MKTLLLISHSSKRTGGGEEDFQKLLMHFYGKYRIYTIFPKGDRSEIFKKYSDKYLEIDGTVFPFTKFKFKEYLGFLYRNYKKPFRIYSFLKKNKNIDLCFINSSVCFIEAMPVVLFKIPYILSVKEKINPSLVRKIIYTFYDVTVSKIVTISKFLKNKIEELTNKKTVEIIYSAIDEKLFDETVTTCTRGDDKERTFKILNIGSIFPLKGQHVLLKAMQKIQVQDIEAEFVGEIVDHKYFKYISDLKNNMHRKETIKFSIGISKADLIRKMFEADVVVITSKEEGQSLIILEALYLEKPVITTKVGIAPEIIEDNINGLLYDFGDADKLCELILKLRNDNPTYKNLAKKCKDTYLKNFNSAESMKKYEKIFNDCLVKKI